MTLKIDWRALEDAFAFLNEDNGAYLDRKTGELLHWSNPDVTGEEDDTAERVADEPDRYVALEPVDSREAWRWMAEFAETTEEPLRGQLQVALDGAGTFRRFKNVLGGHPEALRRWFELRDEKMREYIERFVEALQLPVENPAAWHTEGGERR